MQIFQMSPKQMKRWERTRAKGKSRYLILNSLWISLFLIAAYFIVVFVFFLLTSQPLDTFFVAYGDTIQSRLFVIVLISCVYSILSWRRDENAYRDNLTSQPQEEEPTESE